MSDRFFLLKVLGLSAVPRILTAFLTLISFSVMVRSLGASEYGVIVYLGAVIGILESFVDFGVSSAAGKGIAEARVKRPQALRVEIANWARLQGMVALAGFVPFVGAAYVAVRSNSSIDIHTILILIVALSAWITIAANFIRACLRSCLSFKALAVLDTAESVARSASWLVVAWFAPTTMGLAVAGLIVTAVPCVVGSTMLRRVLRKSYTTSDRANAAEGRQASGLPYRMMLKESFSFLGLRVATRMFQALPIVVIGRVFGADIVGIVGSFGKIAEQLTFPFAVIGNALAVRAQEVKSKGDAAVVALWDAAVRFVVSSGVLAGGVFLAAGVLAHILTPASQIASTVFAILSLSVITSAVSSVIPPMSDYVGALRQRVVLIAVCTIAQLPVIWIGGNLYGQVGAVAAYVLAMLLMNGGYLSIAKKAFLGRSVYVYRSEVWYLMGLTVTALGLSVVVRSVMGDGVLPRVQHVDVSLLQVLLFGSLIVVGVGLSRRMRAMFFSWSFFDFSAER